MATIALNYDIRKKQTRKIQYLNLSTRRKTGLEEALEDVANGRLTTIHIPKNLQT